MPPAHSQHTRFRGVSYDRVAKKWRARIYCSGRHITLGRFTTQIEAAQMHDGAAYYVHGKEAVTNFGTREARALLAARPPSSSSRAMLSLREIKGQVDTHRHQQAVRRDILRARRRSAAQLAGVLNVCRKFVPYAESSHSLAIGSIIYTLVRIGVRVSTASGADCCARSTTPARQK
jgi:AP2 domain